MRTAPLHRLRREPVEKILQILADRTRLRLLNLMSGQEICVCYLVEVLRTSQPKISRHLALLRKAGIVTARREGKWMHYRIAEAANPAAARILEQLRPLFAGDAEMRRDEMRLGQACCAPQKFVNLTGAPVPAPIAGKMRPRRVSIGTKGKKDK